MLNKTRSDAIEDLSSTLTYVELVLLGTAMIAICVATVVGNALVLLSFALDKKLRTLSNYFLLSLAVSDFMIATFSMPLFTVYFLTGEWTMGSVLCNMWLSQDYTCSNASVLNLLMIAIDRYCSVTDPLRYRAKRTSKRVGIMIACVWIISFLLYPPWIYAWPYIEGKSTVPEDDCYIQFLETNTLVTVLTTAFDYYLPLAIILGLYYRIWRETRRRSRYLADMETGYQAESVCLRPLSCPPKPIHAGYSNGSTDKSSGREDAGTCLLARRGELVHAGYSKDSTGHDNASPWNEADKEGGASLLADASDTGLETTPGSEADVRNAGRAYPDSKTSDNDSSFSGQSVQPKSTPVSLKGGAKGDKAARVLTVILLAFVVTSLPYNIEVIIKNLDHTQTIVPDAVWNFSYYLFYINSTLNPLCYALANENFKRTYWRILTCSWSKNFRGTSTIGSYSSKSIESKISSCTKQSVTSSV